MMVFSFWTFPTCLMRRMSSAFYWYLHSMPAFCDCHRHSNFKVGLLSQNIISPFSFPIEGKYDFNIFLSIQCQPLKKIYTHIIRFFFQGKRPFMLFIFPWSLSWNPLVFLVRIQIRQPHQRISGRKAYWCWALFVGWTLRRMGKKGGGKAH